MSRAVRVLGVVLVGAIAAGIASFVGTTASVHLALLAAALVAGELFELRPASRAPLPLSFAVVVVLVRAATPEQAIVVAVAAYAVAVALRTDSAGLGERLVLLIERICEACAAVGAYRLIVESAGTRASQAVVLGALAAAAVAQIVVADVVTVIRLRRVAHWRTRSVDLALVTSGMLMAVGYGGILGRGHLGLWGPLLFAIPLIAAWYSFELLASTRRNFVQTVRALGMAPELGGLVRAGHGERAAGLAVAMGRDLGLSPGEVDQLETAALLHHLGAVCLDEPAETRILDAGAVATSSAAILRGSEALARAGDIVASEPSLHRPPGEDASSSAILPGQILKVASAYDELTEGEDAHARWAVEALYTGPGYVYDGRVLGALERTLARRGIESLRG